MASKTSVCITMWNAGARSTSGPVSLVRIIGPFRRPVSQTVTLCYIVPETRCPTMAIIAAIDLYCDDNSGQLHYALCRAVRTASSVAHRPLPCRCELVEVMRPR